MNPVNANREATALRERLRRGGIALVDQDAGEATPSLETPWFVRALQAASGWLAAVLLLGFIAVGVAFVLDSGIAAATLGLVMIAAAYAMLRMVRGDFLEHLALAGSLTGQLLLAWALADAFGDVNAALWWALVGLQVVLVLAMPSLTHRTFSAFAACLAFYLAMTEGASAPSLATGLVLLVLTALWLNEFRWPARIRQLQALGHGLLLGLLAIQAMGHSGHFYLMGGSGVVSPAWLEPWAGDALGALALLLVLKEVFRRHARAVPIAVRAATYGAVAVLLLISFQAHGLSQGAVVVMLGFAIGNRMVMGIGVLSLLFAIISYYYWLDVTLLAKAGTLAVIGVLLLAIRWAIRRHWHTGADAGEKAP